MKRCLLQTSLAVVMLAITGCGDNATTPAPPAMNPNPFELEGAWLYLGPSDGPHTLTITRTTMAYADVDGKWSSTWSLKTYDNGLHQFQVAFESGSGNYLPVGQNMSGAYAVNGTLLTTQLTAGTAYPPVQDPGTCTDAATGAAVPDCRLYVKH